ARLRDRLQRGRPRRPARRLPRGRLALVVGLLRRGVGLPPRRPHRPAGRLRSHPHQRAGRPAPAADRQQQPRRPRHPCAVVGPQAPGPPARLWGRKAVRELIGRGWGSRMPVGGGGESLKRGGYPAKKPSRHNREQDPEEVRRWLEETYPALRRKAKEEGAEIL